MSVHNIPFSQELEQWLSSKKNTTVDDLRKVTGEKSFAIVVLICMFIPALPLPTGGITTVLLVPATLITAFQMMFGRRALWLPARIKSIRLGDKTLTRALPFIIRRIRWFERFSQPRLADYVTSPIFRIFTGFMIFLCALGAFVAPPFSGLDTLPAMGAVIIALGIMLEDILLILLGMVVGAIGIGLLVAAATLVIAFVQQLF